jgi:MFS family permease
LALPAGRLADRHGYHLPMRLALGLSIAGSLSALLSTSLSATRYPLLCLAAVLCGAGSNVGLITTQRSAGRLAHDASELRRTFSWLGIAPPLSNVVGPLSAGLLIDHVGFGAAFALLSVLPLLTLLFASLVPREVPQAAAAAETRPPTWDLLSAPMMRRLLLVNWFMSASWDVHSFVVPVLGHERDLSASAIGTVLGVFSLAVTTVRLAIPILAQRLTEAQVLSAAMAVVAAVFAFYPWASSVWAMSACAALLGFALGASQPMVMTALHQVTPRHRHGEAIALRSMALNLSSAVMPLGFGLLGTALGASGLFWAMSALVASGVLFARTLDTRPTP